MKLIREEVWHIARLACMGLSELEVEIFEERLSTLAKNLAYAILEEVQ